MAGDSASRPRTPSRATQALFGVDITNGVEHMSFDPHSSRCLHRYHHADCSRSRPRLPSLKLRRCFLLTHAALFPPAAGPRRVHTAPGVRGARDPAVRRPRAARGRLPAAGGTVARAGRTSSRVATRRRSARRGFRRALQAAATTSPRARLRPTAPLPSRRCARSRARPSGPGCALTAAPRRRTSAAGTTSSCRPRQTTAAWAAHPRRTA